MQLIEDENALLRREVEARVAAYDPFRRESELFPAEYVDLEDVDDAACHVIRILELDQ